MSSLSLITIFVFPGQAWSFLSHLPVLQVELSVKGWWEESQQQTERPLPAAGANLRDESTWLDVHADQEYVLQVSLRRLNLGQQRVSTPHTVHCDIRSLCVASDIWYEKYTPAYNPSSKNLLVKQRLHQYFSSIIDECSYNRDESRAAQT